MTCPEMNRWFVFYTYPKCERIVKEDLCHNKLDVFLPLYKTIRQWSDRKKKLEVPLFPNYIFVNTNKCMLGNVLSHPKVIKCVKFNNEFASIQNKEIEKIKRVIGLDTSISVDQSLKRGDTVKVVCGPLAGMEGIVIQDNSHTRLGIHIKVLQQTILVDIGAKDLEKTDQNVLISK